MVAKVTVQVLGIVAKQGVFTACILLMYAESQKVGPVDPSLDLVYTGHLKTSY